MVYICDILFVVFSGLLRIIVEGLWDIKLFWNLYDSDFDMSCIIFFVLCLDFELMLMLFLLVRYKLSFIMGWLIDVNIFYGFLLFVEM